jgi:3-hydroxyisobutyrate dehydrogenase
MSDAPEGSRVPPLAGSSIGHGREAVGFIGVGVMGGHIVQHLLSAGYVVTVFARTPSKAAAAVTAGAVLATSAEDAVSGKDVVFTMLGFPDDVRDVLLGNGSSRGVLHAVPAGCVVVDMTTSSAELAVQCCAAGRERGVYVVDAPVTGGDVGAREGSLSVLVGGDACAVAAVRPLMACFSAKVTRFGEAGTGQHAKAGNQVAVAASMIGMCEAMVYAHKAGLDVREFMVAIRDGAAGSRSIDLYADRILDGDFAAGFYVRHFVKDLGLVVDECRKLGICLPGLSLATQLYNALVATSEEEFGTHALIHVLERMNNVRIVKSSTI